MKERVKEVRILRRLEIHSSRAPTEMVYSFYFRDVRQVLVILKLAGLWQ